MKTNDWLYETISERVGEILNTYGYDEELSDVQFEVLCSLEKDVKENVDKLIARMERSKFDDFVSIYQGGFHDGMKYMLSIMRHQEPRNLTDEECIKLFTAMTNQNKTSINSVVIGTDKLII